MLAGKVFLSYAHEDAEAAARIAEALRAAGVEVWFDKGELRGGDVWDQKIRQQVHDCSLFVPVVSASTQARSEGYFRREWNMAVDRMRDMSGRRSFVVPVVVDETDAASADVPEDFLKAQCTCLPRGETPPEFVAQVKALLQDPRAIATPAARATSKRPSRVVIAATLAGLLAVAVGLFLLRPREATLPAMAAMKPEPVSLRVAPDDRSIAVLPFVDMSEAHDQGFMSEGLAEELLNLLAKVPALHVTSRTSAFSFKGKNVAIPEIGRQLNVAHVLEGSVRKSGARVRITAQLIDARSDTHLWSETYDRAAGDIFAVQDEIAASVAKQLRIALLGTAAKTRAADPRAYSLFLEARQSARTSTAKGLDQAIALYRKALAIDPRYAAAWVGLGSSHLSLANKALRPIEESYRLGREAVNKAIAIDPDYAPAHFVLSRIASDYDNDLPAAARELERAIALDPSSAEIVAEVSGLAQSLGRLDLATRLDEYSVARDPVNPSRHGSLGYDYVRTGRLDEAIASYRRALAISPNRVGTHYNVGEALLRKGDAKAALAEMMAEPEENWRMMGIALVRHTLGPKQEADALLAQFIGKYEKESAFNIAYVYAWRGEIDRAFEWLDKAVAYHDTGLVEIIDEPFFSNLHGDPRWLPFLRKIGKAPEQVAKIRLDVKLPTEGGT